VAGLDEAGRGAWAGPVVAAAVVLPLERFDLARQLAEVRDSKQLTVRQRERCAEAVLSIALSAAVGQAEAAEVDALGLLPATRAAMGRALAQLSVQPRHLLLDHLRLPESPLEQSPITHGDALVLSIAAASVLAKVARDRLLVELDRLYPGYGLARHKGYGTAEHLAALLRLGPSPIHRRSYAPVAAAAGEAAPVRRARPRKPAAGEAAPVRRARPRKPAASEAAPVRRARPRKHAAARSH
jgi:ribonuclease HII